MNFRRFLSSFTDGAGYVSESSAGLTMKWYFTYFLKSEITKVLKFYEKEQHTKTQMFKNIPCAILLSWWCFSSWWTMHYVMSIIPAIVWSKETIRRLVKETKLTWVSGCSVTLLHCCDNNFPATDEWLLVDKLIFKNFTIFKNLIGMNWHLWTPMCNAHMWIIV